MKLSELLKILEEKKQRQERIKFLRTELKKIQSAEEKKRLEELLQKELEAEREYSEEKKKREEELEQEEIKEELPEEAEQQRLQEATQALEETIQREQEEHDLRKETSPLAYQSASQVDLQLYTAPPTETNYQGTSPTIERLANTFIKEGLLTDIQEITPDQNDAIMKRLEELNPGASAEKIINYFNAIKQGDFKKEGVYKHKLE